jgi:integrase
MSTFTDRTVFTLPPPIKGRTYFKSANGPTGFTLMVTATGYRCYYMVYKPKVGPTRHRKIGPCEDVSFKDARAEAERLRGLVASGHDPAGDEKAARQAKRSAHVVSLRECVNYFLEANRKRLDKKTTQAHEQTRDALPRRFMDSPAEDATAATYREAVREATRAPIMQNRHLGRLKAVLRFAYAEQKITRLPALVGMKRPHDEVRRERVLTAAEIRALWTAVDTIKPTMPRSGVAFAASVRLMLLLGTRLGETITAEWSEFDLDGDSPRSEAIPKNQPTWYIPAEHRKGEKGKKRPHWIPLPPLAVSILRELRETTGEKPAVFYQAGYASRTYMLGKLLAEMKNLGQAEPWTYHDERRTVSTNLGDLGCPDEVNDLILGHAKKGVLKHYDHSKRIAGRLDWLTRWESKVRDIVGLPSVHVETGAVLHLYRTANGLPELRATREANRGRDYVGAFPPHEALRRAEDVVAPGLTWKETRARVEERLSRR